MRLGSPTTTVRILAAVSVLLALMCAGLAYAWSREHESAACWRAAAEARLETDLGCGG